MEHASVQKTAKVLRVLVLVVFVLNLLCLLLTPGATAYVADGGSDRLFRALQGEVERWMGQGEHFPMGIIFVVSWWAVWSRAETAVLTVFFWLCGVCNCCDPLAGKKSAGHHPPGQPLPAGNARALKRAAVCCWIISGASLVRSGSLDMGRWNLGSAIYLHYSVCPSLFYGRPAVPGHVRPVWSDGGAERGPGSDHLRRDVPWGSW